MRSAAAHRIKNCSTKKDACVGVFFDAFGCSGRGKGAPHCAALPQEAAKTSIYSGGRKRILVLGKVRADGALTQRVSAAGCCTAQSASVPCAFRDAVGCFGHCVLHGEVWWRSLPTAPRSSALQHGPPMPRRGAGWYLNAPHRECLYHVLSSVCGHTQRGCAASLFICT